MITADRSTPNQIAERLTGRNYLSYSAVNLFRSCPLRFGCHITIRRHRPCSVRGALTERHAGSGLTEPPWNH